MSDASWVRGKRDWESIARKKDAEIARIRAKLEKTMARVDALAGELFDASNDVERLRAELAEYKARVGSIRIKKRAARVEKAAPRTGLD